MNEQELKIKNFTDDWNGHGYEKGDTQKFWLGLLRKVLNVAEPERIIDFEKTVKIDKQTNYIDGYIARTKILIEQKSFGFDLSDGVFEQGKRYADNMTYSERPRWIVTCNFVEFRVYDLVDMQSLEYLLGLKNYEPWSFKLAELRYVYKQLNFLIDPDDLDFKPEFKISRDAAAIIKIIYDVFKRNYERDNVADYRNLLDKLCTRLVFCFYASYAQIIDDKQFFHYLLKFDESKRLDALQKIFLVLNTPDNLRGDLDNALKNFPHINGGLFAETIPLPKYNRFDRDLTSSILAADNDEKLNWRKIDPPIFGAMFESILKGEDRRAGGMHYTSPENIRKVIDPLFMDDLHAEFLAAKNKHIKNRPQALLNLQDKLASLKFFDPACGSGNFLTVTYMSLRRLENDILNELRGLKVTLPENPVKVSINQFYGVEINDFAVAVAQTALWIAENQMLQETEGRLGINLEAFPIKNYATIKCTNALRVDWSSVVAPENLNYIIGNPPFVGARLKSTEQARDLQRVFSGWQNIGNLDYVACWFKRAADFIRGKNIRCAFVATNSVCQGDSVGALWKNLFADGVHIDFAHRTFKWLSDSDNMAHVHCVVVGFSSAPNTKPKKIFTDGNPRLVDNINAYLVDGEDIFVESRNEHYQAGVPSIGIGNKPIDGGNYLFTPEEMDDFIRDEPASAKYFRPWFGAEEFIKGKRRFCLLLKDLSLDEIKKMPHCLDRVWAVMVCRLKSKSKGTRKIAATPTKFHFETFPHDNYILVPSVSSEQRKYIPMGFMPPNAIASNLVFVISDARLYHFGILTSSIHMAWVRAVAGRLEMRYRYSAKVVYNNFPWPAVTAVRRQMIEHTAQEILAARAKFPTWTFAKLYDEATMPDELRLAHHANDYAVALAYGFEKFFHNEERVVAELMKLYRRLTDG